MARTAPDPRRTSTVPELDDGGQGHHGAGQAGDLPEYGEDAEQKQGAVLGEKER
jgi:hypothetical protein